MTLRFDTPEDIRQAYEEGFPGCRHDPEDALRFFAESPVYYTAEEAMVGSGAGKRALLWRSRELYDPGGFQERQRLGDCVSFGDRNARDTTRAVQQHIKQEPIDYFKRGATEPTYGARGYSGDGGMVPSQAARFVRDQGWLVRQRYPFADLTEYNPSFAYRWGGGMGEDILTECRKHNVGSATAPTSHDEAADLLANGYAGHSGQSLGFARNSNAKGISPISGRWAHDMAIVGYDDVKDVYPERVWFIMNSWGAWNSKPAVWPEELFGPWIPGLIVASDEAFGIMLSARQMFMYSAVVGFPPQKLPDWGAGAYL